MISKRVREERLCSLEKVQMSRGESKKKIERGEREEMTEVDKVLVTISGKIEYESDIQGAY